MKFPYLAILSLAVCSCSGGGGSEDEVRLVGQAFYPPGLQEPDQTAKATDVDVVDPSLAEADRVVATGKTDDNGRFDISTEKREAVAVIVKGKVEISGLIDTNPQEKSILAKDFNEITSIACAAGVTAVLDGAITVEDLDNERIANLENASALLLQTRPIDFRNEEQVNAAAAEVRRATNNGATNGEGSP